MLQSLPTYPSWKATSVPVLWATLLLIYGLADQLHRFVAGIFIPQYHFPYAVALCFAQVSTRSSEDAQDGSMAMTYSHSIIFFMQPF